MIPLLLVNSIYFAIPLNEPSLNSSVRVPDDGKKILRYVTLLSFCVEEIETIFRVCIQKHAWEGTCPQG